jgi:IS30 family transposase
MPRGSHLTEREKGLIQAYHECGWSQRQIANTINRSQKVVQHFLANPVAYGTQRRSGRPSKLTPRDRRRIINAASNSTLSTRQILDELGLNVHRETVRRAIRKEPYIQFSKMIGCPALKDEHKARRLEFARRNMNTNWKKVSVFL